MWHRVGGGRHHESHTRTTTAGNGGNFDPQQAAALLDQTTQRARRKFESSPPWLLVLRGLGVLVALGAVWLSVRGQHPYQHPTAAVVPVVVTFGVLNLIATVTVARRATAGVSGRTRPHWAELTVMGWCGSPCSRSWGRWLAPG